MSRFGDVLLKIRASPLILVCWLWVRFQRERAIQTAVLLSCPARQSEPHRGSLTRVIEYERLPEGHRNLEEQDAFCVSLLERKSCVCFVRMNKAAKSSPDRWTNNLIFGGIPNSIFNLPPTSRPSDDPKHWTRSIQCWSMRLLAQSERLTGQALRHPLRHRSTPPDAEAVTCVCSSTDVPANDKLHYACVDPQRRLIRCQISLRLWRFGM